MPFVSSLQGSFSWFFSFIKKRGKRRLKKKYIIRIGIAMAALLIFFFSIKRILGRSDNDTGMYAVFPYIGAPLANLDHYLKDNSAISQIWGEQTFGYLIRSLALHFDAFKIDYYQLDLPYLTMNGYNTGNVYTTFYMFVHDFGYYGVPPLTAIIAWYYSSTYYKCLRGLGGYFYEYHCIRVFVQRPHYAYVF